MKLNMAWHAQTILLSSYDHDSIHRGHQFSSKCLHPAILCHQYHTVIWQVLHIQKRRQRAIAAEIEVVDGPNDEGEMFTHLGKFSHRFPQPCANEQAARFAHGGAYPPNLSLISKARHNGQNYVFARLTGYHDPPAGVTIQEGLHHNPYFPGGAIAMPKMLIDGAVEFGWEKILCHFYHGRHNQKCMEERKVVGTYVFKSKLPSINIIYLALFQAAYYRRLRWSILKSRKLVFDVVN